MGQSHIERERERAMTRGRTDYTLLLLLSVTTSSGAILRDRHYLAELNPEAGSNWGDWGRLEFCPEGSWASGFQLKVEKDCGAMCDDTALNGVRLFCTGVDGSDRGGVSSLVGGFGSWAHTHSCSSFGSFLRGVQFRSEDETFASAGDDNNRHWDETAGNNLNGACIGGTVWWVTGPTGECGPHTVCVPHT